MSALNFYDNSPAALKYLVTIFPNCGLFFIIQVAFQYERGARMLTYASLYKNLFNDPVNVGGILAMMLTWTIIYIPIAWYIERIFPGGKNFSWIFYFSSRI